METSGRNAKTLVSTGLLPAGHHPKFFRPHPRTVVAAVKSLYADQLRPLGRIILKRLREIAVEESNGALSLEDVPLVDAKELRKICQQCKQLHVQPEEGKEYCVTLVGVQGNFFDMHNCEHQFPEELWDQAVEYLTSLEGESALFPGGRYACAKELGSRQLGFLRSRSFGEICYFVQLAISQRQLLGYANGHIVPFAKSEHFVKLQFADRGIPVTDPEWIGDMTVATWQDIRTCIVDLFCSCTSRGQPCNITLSNVKRIFRCSYRLELSETALGHSRLYDVLSDHRVSDICKVENLNGRQVITPRGVKVLALLAGARREKTAAEAGLLAPQPPLPLRWCLEPPAEMADRAGVQRERREQTQAPRAQVPGRAGYPLQPQHPWLASTAPEMGPSAWHSIAARAPEQHARQQQQQHYRPPYASDPGHGASWLQQQLHQRAAWRNDARGVCSGCGEIAADVSVEASGHGDDSGCGLAPVRSAAPLGAPFGIDLHDNVLHFTSPARQVPSHIPDFARPLAAGAAAPGFSALDQSAERGEEAAARGFPAEDDTDFQMISV